MFHLDVKNLTHVAFQDLQKSLLVPGRQPFFLFFIIIIFFQSLLHVLSRNSLEKSE